MNVYSITIHKEQTNIFVTNFSIRIHNTKITLICSGKL